MVQHTTACYEAFTLHAQHTVAFEAQYPHACQSCRGWGASVDHYSPAPGPGTIDIVEPCSVCEGHEDLATCALCGQIMDQERGTRLCACPQDGAPQPPECLCWMAEDIALDSL